MLLAIVLAMATTPDLAPVPEAPDRASVRLALEHRRAHNLASFKQYIQTGVYPHNTYRDGPLNVWFDASRHYCAAATMIVKDGHQDLAARTAATDNNIRLLDVTDGPLLDWMLTSGFTIEEIDRIQEPGFAIEAPVRDFAAEDAKLKRGYTATVAYLRAHRAADLDKATDRLLKHPDLAWQLVEADEPR